MSTVQRNLRRAISLKQTVRLRQYTPIRRGNTGDRVVEPHALGKSVKRKKPVLRAWVRSGESFSGLDPTDRWRMFRVDRINGVDLLPQSFTVRNGFRPRDRHMKANPYVVTSGIPRRSSRLNRTVTHIPMRVTRSMTKQINKK